MSEAETRFRDVLQHLHQNIFELIVNAYQLQGLVIRLKALDDRNAVALSDLYLLLRHQVDEFPIQTVSLSTIFDELSGGLMSSHIAESPIEEHRQIYPMARNISMAVWEGLDLNEICPAMPTIQLMPNMEEAVSRLQKETTEWCKKAEPINDRDWIASRLLEKYAAVRVCVIRVPLPNIQFITKQLNDGHDATVTRWIRLSADRLVLTQAAQRERAVEPEKPVFKSQNLERESKYKLNSGDFKTLEALLKLGAINQDDGATCEQVAKKADPKKSKTTFKKHLSKLKGMELVDSGRGPNGCSWLTELGKGFIEQVISSRNKKS